MSRNLMSSVLFLVIVAVIAAPASLQADVCESINDLSNGWNGIANALEETADEDVGDLDIDRLERDVNALLAPTEAFGEELLEYGNEEEEALAEDLLDAVDELRDVDGYDLASYLVDRIDDIVDILDDTVDYCDAA